MQHYKSVKTKKKMIKNLHKLLHDAFHFEIEGCHIPNQRQMTKTMDNGPMV